MTATTPPSGDTREAREQELHSLIARRITEWWAEHEDPAAAADAAERKLDAIQRIEINHKIAQYTAVAEGLKALDAEVVLAALRVAADTEPDHPLIHETASLVQGIAHGMQLGAYLDSDSAASWLHRHAPDGATEHRG